MASYGDNYACILRIWVVEYVWDKDKKGRFELNTGLEKRKHTCCFSGHRPEKLIRSEAQIKTTLETEIRRSVNDGFTMFISGMARGVDVWGAEIVLRLRDEGFPIKLICAVPFEGFERSQSADDKARYNHIISFADEVVYVSSHYYRACFQIRNKWMVDRSSRVIAIYDGEKGGTKNTIDYASQTGVEIVLAI